jgi:hypothetical protein
MSAQLLKPYFTDTDYIGEIAANVLQEGFDQVVKMAT